MPSLRLVSDSGEGAASELTKLLCPTRSGPKAWFAGRWRQARLPTQTFFSLETSSPVSLYFIQTSRRDRGDDQTRLRPLLHSLSFAVTEESIETDLQVIGEIPVSLSGTVWRPWPSSFGPLPRGCSPPLSRSPSLLHSGAFIRNGPNPQFPPAGGYHWYEHKRFELLDWAVLSPRVLCLTLNKMSSRFDGDGMLHSLRLKDGKARIMSVPLRLIWGLIEAFAFVQAVSYANHWVRTHRFEKEREAGIPTFNKARQP